MSTVIDVERLVNERYGQAAHNREPELCCAVDYAPKYSVSTPMKSKSAITAYASDILPVAPYQAVSLEEAAAFDCPRSALRDPRETKGLDYEVTDLSGRDCCEPGTNCC